MKTNEPKTLTYDSARKCWIADGRIVRCAHLRPRKCKCYGRKFAGRSAVTLER